MNQNHPMVILWNYIALFSTSHSSFLSSLFYWLSFKVKFQELIEIWYLQRRFSGLIIDAFGDLREQLDSVKETLEVINESFIDRHYEIFFQSKCFICGIGQDYFDKEPHGFEVMKICFLSQQLSFLFQTHTTAEHNFANYMFFLTHLLNKPDTEHTGQVRLFRTIHSFGKTKTFF